MALPCLNWTAFRWCYDSTCPYAHPPMLCSPTDSSPPPAPRLLPQASPPCVVPPLWDPPPVAEAAAVPASPVFVGDVADVLFAEQVKNEDPPTKTTASPLTGGYRAPIPSWWRSADPPPKCRYGQECTRPECIFFHGDVQQEEDNNEDESVVATVAFPVRKTKPGMYKKEICRNWRKYGTCRYGKKCSFAHGTRELRRSKKINRSWKRVKCTHFWEQGSCPYGERCFYIHNESPNMLRRIRRTGRVCYLTHEPTGEQ